MAIKDRIETLMYMAERYEHDVMEGLIADPKAQKYEPHSEDNIGTFTIRGFMLGMEFAMLHPQEAKELWDGLMHVQPMPSVVRRMTDVHHKALLVGNPQEWIDLGTQIAKEEDQKKERVH